MTATTFADRGDTIETVTEEKIESIKKGPVGRFFSYITHHPKQIIGYTLAAAAVGGAGYMAYDAVKAGRAQAAADHIKEAGEALAAFA